MKSINSKLVHKIKLYAKILKIIKNRPVCGKNDKLKSRNLVSREEIEIGRPAIKKYKPRNLLTDKNLSRLNASKNKYLNKPKPP